MQKAITLDVTLTFGLIQTHVLCLLFQ